jgi:hypothetical protein
MEMKEEPTQTEERRKTIKREKNNKSPGTDVISTQMLKLQLKRAV